VDRDGCPDPRQDDSTAEMPETDPAAAAAHWAFQPPVLVDPPAVQAADWPRTDIDRFVLASLEQHGLTPSPLADRRAQLRRLHYDLTGLPPSADELAAFAAADDQAYAAAVDRLLESPQFGERWGRHWLDVARYADTKGYVFQEDRNYPHAYTYRDWVIQAFNQDMPYDQFILAQLAADHLDDPSAKPATGFLTLGRRFINNRHDIIDDRIDVMTRGLMGLTVSCARCHDHKYDPIPTADYYALYGVFASSHEPGSEAAPLLLVDADQPYDPVIFVRGSPGNRGDRVPRRFLSCLSEGEPQPFERGSGRWEMAQAIANGANPLTARVWVNRVWLRLFGEGLVTTPSDFGTRSDPPSHPELLDWLACRLVQQGWSTKWLIRQIVLSNVYRQASDYRADCAAVDPENRLLWRMNRRRLDLEALRDSLLVAAGRLDTAMGGPSVELTQEPFPVRRTVYGFVERQNLPAMFRTFDFAGPDTHSPKRPYHHGASAGLVPDEQPVRVAAGDASGRTRRSETGRDGRPADSPAVSFGSGASPRGGRAGDDAAVRSFCRRFGGNGRGVGAGDMALRVGVLRRIDLARRLPTIAAFHGQCMARRSSITRPGTRLGHAQRRRRSSGQRCPTCSHPALDRAASRTTDHRGKPGTFVGSRRWRPRSGG
jgi:hypothetical protein